MQNLSCTSKGVKGRRLKTLWKWAIKNGVFVFIFDIFYTDMHHWCNFFLNLSSLRLIWGRLCSFQLIYRLTHLSAFRAMLRSYRIILNVFRAFWVRLGSFRPILAYLRSFRLIWVHLDSLELIKAHLSSFRLIQVLLGLCRLIWALLRPFRLIYAHLSLF